MMINQMYTNNDSTNVLENKGEVINQNKTIDDS